jgi:diamine N-acetyltransferase
MTDIFYRAAAAGDSPVVADLFARCFIETFGHLYDRDDLDAFLGGATAEAFAREIADPDFALAIAEQAGTPAGFAKIGPPGVPIDTPQRTLELRQIYVLQPWQGQGVAGRLYDWVEAEARRRGAGHLQLTVFIDNHRARRFYERRGFVPVGRCDFMVGKQADEDIVMRKSCERSHPRRLPGSCAARLPRAPGRRVDRGSRRPQCRRGEQRRPRFDRREPEAGDRYGPARSRACHRSPDP